MRSSLAFPDHLRLIDERSTAFRAAVASAPDTDAQVPTCPDWTLLDLVQHLGQSHRRWAATVAAGPAGAPPAETRWASSPPDQGRDAVLSWSAESTSLLLDALSTAGPDAGCWTWWGGSQTPPTCAAVARHQLQHVTVHTYDAQIVHGEPEPLPPACALDGVDEFLSTSVAGPDAWPHEASAVDCTATDGGSWRLSLTATGTQVTRLDGSGSQASAASGPAPVVVAELRGTASDLLLALYARVPLDALELTGNRLVFDQLLAWDPDA